MCIAVVSATDALKKCNTLCTAVCSSCVKGFLANIHILMLLDQSDGASHYYKSSCWSLKRDSIESKLYISEDSLIGIIAFPNFCDHIMLTNNVIFVREVPRRIKLQSLDPSSELYDKVLCGKEARG